MSILILYGSETGTAQDIAESLRREAEMRHVSARVFELDEFNMNELYKEIIVIFVLSTTGQGEMPPNMRKSWMYLLRKSLPSDYFRDVNMSVVGLGDSSYQKYNFAGKKMYRRLVQLGARMMTDICLADDQHEIGIDGAFIPWKKHMWDTVYKLSLFAGMTSDVDQDVIIKPKYIFKNFEETEFAKSSEKKDFFGLRVENTVRVTSAAHFQETTFVRFEITESNREFFRYRPGDVLMVKPYNPKETVDVAIEALGYSDELLDRSVQVIRNDEFVKLPPYYLLGIPTTLRTCLERYFDLQQVPKRSFFEILSYYSNNAAEKERLAELASPEGLDDLLDYANRCRRTTAETLRDFPATTRNLQPDQLFEIFKTIRARAFSIASAPNSKYVEILVAKVEYSSRMADKRRGLCSTFVSRLSHNDEVFCKLRPGTFKFPAFDQPVICIGPGTGVAPFRSLFVERSHSFQRSHPISLFFFGCRSQYHDFYFSDEWSRLEGVQVVVAFSRDTEKKVYVQHKMGEYALELKRLLDQGAHVFIAGSSGDMPKAVSGVLKQIKGEDWTAKAEATGKIQYETWS